MSQWVKVSFYAQVPEGQRIKEVEYGEVMRHLSAAFGFHRIDGLTLATSTRPHHTDEEFGKFINDSEVRLAPAFGLDSEGALLWPQLSEESRQFRIAHGIEIRRFLRLAEQEEPEFGQRVPGSFSAIDSQTIDWTPAGPYDGNDQGYSNTDFGDRS